MAKALIGIFRALKRQDLYERKKRVRSLPNIEALRKPSRMISNVHAISADINNYRYSTWNKKFLRFLCSPNNCYCRYCFTVKIISSPCAQGTHFVVRITIYTLQKYKENMKQQKVSWEKCFFRLLGTFEPSPNLEPSTCLKVLQYSS